MRIPAKMLRSALSTLKPLVAHRPTIPILACVRIEPGRLLRIEATDLETWAKIPLNDEGSSSWKEGPAVVVRLRDLQSAVKGATGDVTIEGPSAPGKMATVTAGAMSSELEAFDPADWPPMPTPAKGATDKARWWKFKPAAFALVRHARSTDFTRPNLLGAFLDPEGGALVAADGHRLALTVVGVQGTPSASEQRGIIIPALACDLIAAIGAHRGETFNPPTVAGNPPRRDLWLRAGWPGECEVVTRLIDGQFPDYRMIIPKDDADDRVLKLSSKGVEELRAALKALIPTAADPSTGVVKVHLNGAIDLSTMKAKAKVNVGLSSGKPLTIGFSARYLLDALPMKGPATVRFSDELSPCRIDAGDETRVVMPCRV